MAEEILQRFPDAVITNAVDSFLRMRNMQVSPGWMHELCDAFHVHGDVKRCRVNSCPYKDNENTPSIQVLIENVPSWVCARCYMIACYHAKDVKDTVMPNSIPSITETKEFLKTWVPPPPSPQTKKLKPNED